jgi:hypothetical protein
MFGKLALSTCTVALVVAWPALAQAPQTSRPGTTFSVCEGEYERECREDHDAYTYCGTIRGWAEQACKIQNSPEPPKYQLIKMNDRAGNRCGYAIWRVICIN